MDTMLEIPSHHSHKSTDHILRPRAVKPINAQVLRTQSEERGLKPNGISDVPSGISR